MRSTLLAATLATAAIGASLLGCATDTSPGTDPEDGVFVDDSKADDFFSVSAQEYVLTGKSSVTLDASLASAPAAQKLEAAKKLIGYKQIALAWFITQYLVDKEEEEANHDFGGFGGMAKAGAYEDLQITPRADGVTYDFTFKQLAAGNKNMLMRLPVRASGGKQLFDLEVGKPSNTEMAQLETNSEWYRSAPWTDWNPANVDAAKKEKMTFEITREKESTDAYFDVPRLVADGKLDIDLYFGWDYHSEFHLKHSKAMFTWLKTQGFTTPAASWDALTADSGAFTKNIKANGKPVKVELRMYFGKPGTATDPDTDAGGKKLEALALNSLATRDVVMYSGHSGPFYGFALANWRKTTEGDLDDADIRVAPMPADRYQVVLAEGCDTYQIGTAFKENPNKANKNVDIVTTTSFSNASVPLTVQHFLTHIAGADATTKEMQPRPVSTLLTQLDSQSWGFTTMYGMHGIDDNPKLAPFANTSKFGKACAANADCGGDGNLCIGAASAKKCTASCTATAACGTGYTCKAVASTSSATIFGKACAKTN